MEWPTHNIFVILKKIMIEKFLRIVGLQQLFHKLITNHANSKNYL